jgi:hypothetical protein
MVRNYTSLKKTGREEEKRLIFALAIKIGL